MSIFTLTTVILIFLKAFHVEPVTTWNWFTVIAPAIVGAVVYFLVFFFAALVTTKRRR